MRQAFERLEKESVKEKDYVSGYFLQYGNFDSAKCDCKRRLVDSLQCDVGGIGGYITWRLMLLAS